MLVVLVVIHVFLLRYFILSVTVDVVVKTVRKKTPRLRDHYLFPLDEFEVYNSILRIKVLCSSKDLFHLSSGWSFVTDLSRFCRTNKRSYKYCPFIPVG